MEVYDELEKALKEIERLKEKIIRLNIKNLELTTIIKEVREYIEENYPTSTINYQDDKYKLLEILDKVDKENI